MHLCRLDDAILAIELFSRNSQSLGHLRNQIVQFLTAQDHGTTQSQRMTGNNLQ